MSHPEAEKSDSAVKLNRGCNLPGVPRGLRRGWHPCPTRSELPAQGCPGLQGIPGVKAGLGRRLPGGAQVAAGICPRPAELGTASGAGLLAWSPCPVCAPS